MENKYQNLLTSTTLIPLRVKAMESVSESPILHHQGHGLDYYNKK